MEYTTYYFIDIFIPIAAGLVFFALAKFVAYIGPLRQFSAGGKQTYDRAYWGFIAFGLYLGSRPLQVLLGPHPMPLIINNIREFFMIGVFGPSIFLAIYGLAYGGEKIKPWLNTLVYGLGMICATTFIIINISAIGGSEEIFKIGNYTAYDGLWFKNLDIDTARAKFMSYLFIIRVTDPVLVLFAAATIAMHRAFTYPADRKKIYNNMPKKLIFTAIGTYCFSLSMLMVGFIWLLGKVPNQWWGYYLGAFLAGIFESMSIQLPMRDEKGI
jgi:hypothetical protein